MTIYEQIQNAIDYIEKNLCNKITFDEVSRYVGMSSRSFYNYFWCITGYTYKEYVIKRRLTEAVNLLYSSHDSILKIALDVGYESHEAFTRSFKRVFGSSPINFRQQYQHLNRIEKINLLKQIYMGTIVKELPKLRVVSFEGFAPEPEKKASMKMKKWLKINQMENKPHRVFGHNIDQNGNLSFSPENVGYKFMVTIEDEKSSERDVKMEVIEPGKFIVTGIEGNLESDGGWIMEGWSRLNKLIQDNQYKIKKPPRWFEEELEPSKPGNLRLDLYLEIEE